MVERVRKAEMIGGSFRFVVKLRKKRGSDDAGQMTDWILEMMGA